MGYVLMPGSGGNDTSEVTAAASDVIKGKVIINQNGDKITGTLECTGNAAVGDVVKGQTFYNTNPQSKQTGTLECTGNAAVGDVVKGQTFYNTNPKSKQTGTLELTGNAAAGDVLKNQTFYSTNPKSKLTGTLELTGNAGTGDVVKGQTFYNTNAKSKQTGTMETMAGTTITPSTSVQTIACSGKKMTSNIVVNAAPGVSTDQTIFNLGTYTHVGGIHPYYVTSPTFSNLSSGPWLCEETTDWGATIPKGCVLANGANNVGNSSALMVFKGTLQLKYFTRVGFTWYNGVNTSTISYRITMYLISPDKSSYKAVMPSPNSFTFYGYATTQTVVLTIPEEWRTKCFLGVNIRNTTDTAYNYNWCWMSKVVLYI